MKCPACGHTLTEIPAGEVLVDICAGGCGGVWLDEFEIKKFDEPHEFAPARILEAKKNPDAAVQHEGGRDCPKCGPDAYLIRRWFSPKNQVEVDQCSKCSGIWLDLGELETIRSQYKTEEERLQAADTFLQPFKAEALESFKAGAAAAQAESERYKEADTFGERVTLFLKELISVD